MPNAPLTIGVLGGGQLGRMLGLAGLPLGLRFRFLEREPKPPAGVLGEVFVGNWDRDLDIAAFVTGLDLVTYEFENVPVTIADRIAERLTVHPTPAALATAQDRLAEKRLFNTLGIPTTRFAPVSTRRELEQAIEFVGLPAILKTRRGGYDGKGQARLIEPADADPAWRQLGDVPGGLILDQFLQFDRELSILGARNVAGATAFYPLVENLHDNGILRCTIAPAPDVSDATRAAAESAAAALMSHFDYVGVLAIEFFDDGGALLANEFAPRVHNSGHWTIEGAATSQFENHLRAIAGWALGPTEVTAPAIMLNLLSNVPALTDLLGLPGVHPHLYDKSARTHRKLGHVTVLDARLDDPRVATIRDML